MELEGRKGFCKSHRGLGCVLSAKMPIKGLERGNAESARSLVDLKDSPGISTETILESGEIGGRETVPRPGLRELQNSETTVQSGHGSRDGCS
jgi:hypothetical protein